MKKLLTLALLLVCLKSKAVNIYFNIGDFSSNPLTNRTVFVQSYSVPTVNQSSVIVGGQLQYTTDSNGQFTITNASLGFLYQIRITPPPNGGQQTVFMIYAPQNISTNTTYNGSLLLVANSTSTFAAGSVAWAAAISDLRYIAASNGVPDGYTIISTNGTYYWGVPVSAPIQHIIAGDNMTGTTNGVNVILTSTGGGGSSSNITGTAPIIVTPSGGNAGTSIKTDNNQFVTNSGALSLKSTLIVTNINALGTINAASTIAGASDITSQNNIHTTGGFFIDDQFTGSGNLIPYFDNNGQLNQSGDFSMLAGLVATNQLPANLAALAVNNGANLTNLIATNLSSTVYGVGKVDGTDILSTNGVIGLGQIGINKLPPFDPTFVQTNGSVIISQNPFRVTNGVVSGILQFPTNNTGQTFQMWGSQQFQWGGYNGSSSNLATVFMNPTHGGVNNGSELQFSANQVSWNLFNGGWMQIGAVDGSGIETYYISRNGTSVVNSNIPSHIFGFQYQYNNGSPMNDFIKMQVVPVSTNGEAVYRIYAPIGGNPRQDGTPTTNMFDIDDVTGVKDYLGLTVVGGVTNLSNQTNSGTLSTAGNFYAAASNTLVGANITAPLTLTPLTATKLVGTDANKAVQSVDIIVTGSGASAVTNANNIVITATGGGSSQIFDPNFVKTNGSVVVAQSPFTITNLVEVGNGSVSGQLTVGGGVATITSGGRYTSNPGGSGTSDFVAGDVNNNVGTGVDYSSITGGTQNTIAVNSDYSFIAGGQSNLISSGQGFIPQFASIGGGQFNVIDTNNVNHPLYAYIAGGFSNYVSAEASYASGMNAKSTFSNSWVWNDSRTKFGDTANSQFLIHAANGVGILTNNPGTNALSVFGAARVNGTIGSDFLSASKPTWTDANKNLASFDIIAGSGMTGTTNSGNPGSIVLTASGGSASVFDPNFVKSNGSVIVAQSPIIFTNITDNVSLSANTIGIGNLSLTNSTAATAANQMLSPSLTIGGNGWGTTAPASQPVAFNIYAQPLQGTTPTEQMVWEPILNHVTNAAAMVITSDGDFTAKRFGTFGATVAVTGNITATANVISGATGNVSWNGRSMITSPVNGTILIQNAAGTANGGIQGTVAADNAAAGNLGETVTSAVAVGSAGGISTASSTNVTSISLTAGDWDVEGNINFSTSSATVTDTRGGISTTTGTLPTDGTEVYSGVQLVTTSALDSVTLPRKRINVSSTTTVYLVGQQTFSVGSSKVFGSITARRIR